MTLVRLDQCGVALDRRFTFYDQGGGMVWGFCLAGSVDGRAVRGMAHSVLWKGMLHSVEWRAAFCGIAHSAF
eukprot:2738958-Rhodomonas_salina.1